MMKIDDATTHEEAKKPEDIIRKIGMNDGKFVTKILGLSQKITTKIFLHNVDDRTIVVFLLYISSELVLGF